MLDMQKGDTITFDPSVFPPEAPVTIAITSGLPQIIQGNLTIDASDAGVILDGSNATGEWQAGLEIVSSNRNTIRGLQVSNFSGPGIAIAGDAENNIIGGDRSIGAGPFGQANLLSNNDNGVVLSTPGTSLNMITGNLIGTDAEGVEGLGNRLGVSITEGAHSNTIGPDNLIAHNSEHGILISNPETVRNTITRNSIHDNLWTDVALWESGNTELAAPMFFDLDLKAGTLTGATCANCTVEIFSDKSDDGAMYEGEAIADRMGVFIFDKGSPFMGPHLTATVTDLDGNTSQFSRPISGIAEILVLQQGNGSPKSILRLKESRELPDNRMGIDYRASHMYPLNWDYPVTQLNATGVKRVDMGLYEIEPPIDWSTGPEMAIPAGADDFIDGLVQHGIQMNLGLHFWDKEGHALGEEIAAPRFQTEGQIQDFADFVRFVVRHFKGRISYYTIWSEPDYCGSGGIKCILPQDYIEMVRRVIPVIREEDPEAKIISAPYVLFFAREDMFTLLRSDVVKQFDIISWHAFYDMTPGHEFFGDYYYEYPAIVQDIKQTASAHGFTGEYWGTDLSWDSYEGAICNTLECRLHTEHPWDILKTNLQAAKYYARVIVMELGLNLVVGLDGFTDEISRFWSYPTMVHLNTVMAGNKPIEIPVEIESDSANITSYGFSLPNGDRLFAVWNDGIAVDYDPGIPATLTFPGTSAEKVIAVDVLHGFEQELITETENGYLVISNFLIKDYPIILRLIE
jgi:hypothetical protein